MSPIFNLVRRENFGNTVRKKIALCCSFTISNQDTEKSPRHVFQNTGPYFWIQHTKISLGIQIRAFIC